VTDSVASTDVSPGNIVTPPPHHAAALLRLIQRALVGRYLQYTIFQADASVGYLTRILRGEEGDGKRHVARAFSRRNEILGAYLAVWMDTSRTS
jgi:hypothetical protein